MVYWSDYGTVIHVRPFQENTVILSIFTKNQGLRKGLWNFTKADLSLPIVSASSIPIGSHVFISWRGKEDMLGQFEVTIWDSMITAYKDTNQLLARQIGCAIIAGYYPPHHINTEFHSQIEAWILGLNTPTWLTHHVAFEIQLLAQFGFPLEKHTMDHYLDFKRLNNPLPHSFPALINWMEYTSHLIQTLITDHNKSIGHYYTILSNLQNTQSSII